jgi:hypothetical protein
MPPRTKTIKVSDQELRMLERAKEVLQREGYAKIAEDMKDALKDPEVKAPTTDLGKLLGTMALGAIAAVGAVAIVKMLTEAEEDE